MHHHPKNEKHAQPAKKLAAVSLCYFGRHICRGVSIADRLQQQRTLLILGRRGVPVGAGEVFQWWG